MFQHTAARRRLLIFFYIDFQLFCFNTQPPEGGCDGQAFLVGRTFGFNTQPPEGGCNVD